jgi:glycosyltransferase involved in cell wall biosynthesis
MEQASRIPVSFLMLTFNEEVNLEVSLPTLAGWAEDVVILDSFSTDRTVEIARRYGARVFQNKFEGHAKQWLWGMHNIPYKNDWIFMHDPDHRIMPELKDELARVFAADIPRDVNGFYVKRRNVFQGKWIRHGGYYPKYMLKIVRRHLVYFDEHEFDYRAYVPGKTVKLENDIIEENLKEEDITFWIEKHNSFATRQAKEELFRAAHPESWKTTPKFFGTSDQRILWLKMRFYNLPLYVRPFLYFFYRYVLCLGFLDGKKGFIFHFLQAFWYRLVVDIKLEQLRTPPP